MKQIIEIDIPEGIKVKKVRDHTTPGWITIELEESKPKKLIFVQQFTDTIEPGMYWTDSKTTIPAVWRGVNKYRFCEVTMKDTIIWKLENEPDI